jgi:membrane fusion protein (multidrug efflux system)
VIDEVLFQDGQDVAEGEVLFRLRDAEQVARLREAEANLALAEEVFARTRKLVTRDAASAAQKDAAAAELGVARARVDLARVALERTEIRAPFDGALGMKLVSPGDRISDETPLVQIDSIARLQLTFPTSEHGIRFARPGLPLELRVGPYPGETFAGEVFFVSPALDPNSRRVIVKAWVPNDDRRLRPGLFANVDMEVGRRENAILVPESAVVFDRQGTYVWRVGDDGAASRVPVQVGLRKAGRVELSLGLRPGDRIVTAGTHKVSEGRKLVAATPSGGAAGQARRPRPVGTGEGT